MRRRALVELLVFPHWLARRFRTAVCSALPYRTRRIQQLLFPERVGLPIRARLACVASCECNERRASSSHRLGLLVLPQYPWRSLSLRSAFARLFKSVWRVTCLNPAVPAALLARAHADSRPLGTQLGRARRIALLHGTLFVEVARIASSTAFLRIASHERSAANATGMATYASCSCLIQRAFLTPHRKRFASS